MNILLRFFMFLYALCGVGISGYFLLVLSKYLSLELLNGFLDPYIGTWEAVATATAVMVLSIISLIISLYSGQKKKMVLVTTGSGKIYITLQAMEKMVERSIRQVYGLHNPKIRITFNDKEVMVRIVAEAHPDCMVAEATQAVQECVQKDLSTSLNKEVSKVDVQVRTVK